MARWTADAGEAVAKEAAAEVAVELDPNEVWEVAAGVALSASARIEATVRFADGRPPLTTRSSQLQGECAQSPISPTADRFAFSHHATPERALTVLSTNW